MIKDIFLLELQVKITWSFYDPGEVDLKKQTNTQTRIWGGNQRMGW